MTLLNVGTQNNPITLNAAAAVALYEMASGGTYKVRRSVAVATLLAEGLIKPDGRASDTHYLVTVTARGRAAKSRMRKSIF